MILKLEAIWPLIFHGEVELINEMHEISKKAWKTEFCINTKST